MTFICPSFLVALALLGEPTPREVTWNGWIVADTGGHMYFFNGPYALTVAPTLHAQLAQWRNRAVKLTGSVTKSFWGRHTELVGVKSIREVAPLEHPCNIEVQQLRLDEHGTLRFTVNLTFPGRSRHWPDGSTFVETDDFRLIIVNEGTGDIIIQRQSVTRGRFTVRVPAGGAASLDGSHQLARIRHGFPAGRYRIFVNLGNVNFGKTPCERGPDAELVVDKAITADAALVPHLSRMGINTSLWLFGTGITDAGLRHIRGLARLETLSLSGHTTDAGLVHVATLKGLRRLHLQETQVTDAGWVHLKTLPNLEELYLGGSRITGDGLRHLKALTALRRLQLGGEQVTETAVAHLSALPTLPELVLSGLDITDGTLARIARLTNLESLSVSGSDVTDKGVSFLATLAGLKHLTLRYVPKVTDASVMHLSKLTGLRSMHLEYSQMTAKGVAALRRGLPDCRIRSPFGPIQHE